MSQPSSQASYLFDRGQADQDRLIRSSEVLGEFVTEACLRAGLTAGGRAIDIGCGPLGALSALADLVGSEGRVVGLDTSGETLALARAILDRRGCTTVTLVQAGLDTVATTDLCPPGPFDLAYVRRFWSISRTPPEASGASRAWCGPAVVSSPTRSRLVPAILLSRRPSRPSSASTNWSMPESGRAVAGMTWHTTSRRSVAMPACASSVSAVSPAVEPLALLETFQAVLRSLRSVILSQGIATGRELEDLLGELEDAKAALYVSSFANLYIEMIAEVPDR